MNDITEDLKQLEPNLLGDTSKLEVSAEELNTAATLASLAIKMLDMASNIYQIHSNVVRLGSNIDILAKSLNQYTMDFEGRIKELKMRVEDVEVLHLSNRDKP